jgi:hypothetical protein
MVGIFICKLTFKTLNQAYKVVRHDFCPEGFGAGFSIRHRFVKRFSAYWPDLERARKDEENEPNLSFLPQTVQKWRSVEMKSRTCNLKKADLLDTLPVTNFL